MQKVSIERIRPNPLNAAKEKEKAKKRQGERTDKHSPNDSGKVGETADIIEYLNGRLVPECK